MSSSALVHTMHLSSSQFRTNLPAIHLLYKQITKYKQVLFSSAACWILTCPYLNSMQRIPAYLLEGVGFFNCMLDTYLDTYLSIPQQHAANTHLLDHEKVPSSQGELARKSLDSMNPSTIVGNIFTPRLSSVILPMMSPR